MEITFEPFTIDEISLLEPKPAARMLPNWYKSLSVYMDSKVDNFDSEGIPDSTAKRCNPLGDALQIGYLILLENSISISKDPQNPNTSKITWARGGDKMIGSHAVNQIHKDLVPKGYYPEPYKFRNFWSISTPKGYSCLFIHPMNREDLPFQIVSGVVDTDSYHHAVNFPFFLKKDFEGVIEAGTPIAQVIPFKREKWTSFFKPFSKNFVEKTQEPKNRLPIKFYKKLHWNRKEYK